MQKFTIYILIFFLATGTSTILANPQYSIPDSLQILRFEVNGISFSMKRIEGGVFIMGGTREQHRETISTDLPTHTIALDAYYIGHTEVTQALWKAVMPEWQIMSEWNNPNYPITDINWYDCQTFVHRLDSITGLPFRLPTEAEWEFAARGGNNSQNYRFAGANIIDSIGWGLSNAGFRKHTVGLKKPNELGLYDMTGNVSEWCYDWFAPYELGTNPNPEGPITGTKKIVRGGSFDNCQANSNISHRHMQNPTLPTNYCGLRLALTLPNEPTLQTIEEPKIVRKLKGKNIKIKFIYVPADVPFYISEEAISKRIWHKVMNQKGEEISSEAIVDKSNSEWNEFLEKCRKYTNEAICFATKKEVEQSITAGVTQIPKLQQKKKSHWEKDTRSIQRHRRNAKKAQKWADLIGVKIKTTDDPTLMIYDNGEKNNQPKWLVIR